MSHLLDIGQKLLHDTYEVERYLGEGAFAEVYRVRHRILGRQAMKVLKMVGTTAETERLLDEAIMLSRIQHRNIVRVFDAGTVLTSAGEECGFFTMEYVAGGSLGDFWKSHRGHFVPTVTTVDILMQICEGLSVAHRADPPIVHRDLKPDNILVGYDQIGLVARVSDFGLAKRADPTSHIVSAHGAPAFKAPEARRDHRRDSTAGDVWAIGTIAYLLLTDLLPYPVSDTLTSLVADIEPPRAPRQLNDEVDQHLEQIVLRALEPDPMRRYVDAMSLSKDLLTLRDRLSSGAERSAQPMQTTSKDSFGFPIGTDTAAANEMKEKALRLARQIGTLPDAADLMEEAFNKDPLLRARYGSRVRLWRKGVVT